MPSRLLDPETIHAVRSREQYAAMHEVIMVKQIAGRPDLTQRDQRPRLPPRLPFAVPLEMRPPVYVGAGKWLIRCICGNAPSVHPEWRMACCLECGAQYTDLAVPEDWEAIEGVLLKRRSRLQMNMRADETLEQLRAENLAHGDPV